MARKIAIISDVHIGVRNSSQIFIDYQQRFFSEVFFPYLDKHNIRELWILGDLFDERKAINIRALHANRKMFLNPLVERNIQTTVIPGNHDVFFKGTNRISSLKELLGYFVEHVTILMEPIEVQYNNTTALWIPWINSENEEQVFKKIEQSKADILLGHLELADFEMNKGIEAKSGLDPRLFKKFKKVLSGHYHTKSTKGNIYYLGSQMQFTWNDCDDQKYFHVLDVDTQKLQAIKNPLDIYKKVVYTENVTKFTSKKDFHNKFVKVIVDGKTENFSSKNFETFIDKIEKSEPHSLKITDNTNYGEFSSADALLDESSEKEDAQEDTRHFMQSYIDNVIDTSLDKKKLQKLLFEIHTEAESLEID